MVCWIVLASYDITCVLRSLPVLYNLGGRVTSRLDLRNNRKVITDYRNLGIIRILTDLVVSLGYLPGVLREAPSRVVPRKASSCGLSHPWGRNPYGLPWVSVVIPHNYNRSEIYFHQYIHLESYILILFPIYFVKIKIIRL